MNNTNASGFLSVGFMLASMCFCALLIIYVLDTKSEKENMLELRIQILEMKVKKATKCNSLHFVPKLRSPFLEEKEDFLKVKK